MAPIGIGARRAAREPLMLDPASYVAHEQLRDGITAEIRALRPEEESDMFAALEQTSAQSLQRRFFVMKRHSSDKERAFFMDINFQKSCLPDCAR